MKKVRYHRVMGVAMVLLSGGTASATPLMHLSLSAHIARGTCDVRVSNSNPVAWRTLNREAFPLTGGAYRGQGFAPVSVAFGNCTTGRADAQGSIRLHAGSVGLQDAGLANRGLWRAGDAGVGFDVLVRRQGGRSGVAHRLTPLDNLLPLDGLRLPERQAQAVPDIDVESRLRSYVKRESITPGVVKTILLLSVVYG